MSRAIADWRRIPFAPLFLLVAFFFYVTSVHAQDIAPDEQVAFMVDGHRIGLSSSSVRYGETVFRLPPVPPRRWDALVVVDGNLRAWKWHVKPTGKTVTFCNERFSVYTVASRTRDVYSSVSSIVHVDAKHVLIKHQLALACSRSLPTCTMLGAHRGYAYKFILGHKEICLFPHYDRQIKRVIDAWDAYRKYAHRQKER
jgi:hypothetical protein